MFLNHSVLVENQNPAADAVLQHDLSVNPLSVILLCLRPLNDTGTLTNFASYLNVCQAINRVDVLHQGASVLSMRGEDAAVMAYLRHGIEPWQNNHDDVNNDRRCVVLPLVLGRRPYDPSSCFPETRRGETVIRLDVDVADTGYDDLQYTIEGIELIGAKPKEFERQVQLTQTFGATGINRQDIPVGRVIRGVLAFGTTAFAGAAPVPSLGRLSMEADGIRVGYSGIDFEVAHMLPSLLGKKAPRFDDSRIRFEDTAGAISNVESNANSNMEIGSGGWQNYCLLDLDPQQNDDFSIDTRKLSRLELIVDAETADAARFIPVEAFPVSALS